MFGFEGKILFRDMEGERRLDESIGFADMKESPVLDVSLLTRVQKLSGDRVKAVQGGREIRIGDTVFHEGETILYKANTGREVTAKIEGVTDAGDLELRMGGIVFKVRSETHAALQAAIPKVLADKVDPFTISFAGKIFTIGQEISYLTEAGKTIEGLISGIDSLGRITVERSEGGAPLALSAKALERITPLKQKPLLQRMKSFFGRVILGTVSDNDRAVNIFKLIPGNLRDALQMSDLNLLRLVSNIIAQINFLAAKNLPPQQIISTICAEAEQSLEPELVGFVTSYCLNFDRAWSLKESKTVNNDGVLERTFEIKKPTIDLDLQQKDSLDLVMAALVSNLQGLKDIPASDLARHVSGTLHSVLYSLTLENKDVKTSLEAGGLSGNIEYLAQAAFADTNHLLAEGISPDAVLSYLEMALRSSVSVLMGMPVFEADFTKRGWKDLPLLRGTVKLASLALVVFGASGCAHLPELLGGDPVPSPEADAKLKASGGGAGPLVLTEREGGKSLKFDMPPKPDKGQAIESIPPSKIIEEVIIKSDAEGHVTMTGLAKDGTTYLDLQGLPKGTVLFIDGKNVPVEQVIVHMERLKNRKIISTFADGTKAIGIPENKKVYLIKPEGKIHQNTVIKAETTEKGILVTTARQNKRGLFEQTLIPGYKYYGDVQLQNGQQQVSAGMSRTDIRENSARKVAVEVKASPEVQEAALKVIAAYRIRSDVQEAFKVIGNLGTNKLLAGVGYARELDKALIDVNLTLNYIQKLSKGETIRNPNSHKIENVTVAELSARLEKEHRVLEAKIAMLLGGDVLNPDGSQSEARLQKGAVAGSLKGILPSADLWLPSGGEVSAEFYSAYGNGRVGTTGVDVAYSPGSNVSVAGYSLDRWKGILGVLNDQEASLYDRGMVTKEDVLKLKVALEYIHTFAIKGNPIDATFGVGTYVSEERGAEPFGQVRLAAGNPKIHGEPNAKDPILEKMLERARYADGRIGKIPNLLKEGKEKDRSNYLADHAENLKFLQAGNIQNVEAAYEAWMAQLMLVKDFSAPDWDSLQTLIDFALSKTIRNLQDEKYLESPELMSSLQIQMKALRGNLKQWSPSFAQQHPGMLEQRVFEIDEVLKEIDSVMKGNLSAHAKKAFMAKVLRITEGIADGPTDRIMQALLSAALKGRTPTPAATSCETSDFSWGVNNNDVLHLNNAFAAAVHSCLAQGYNVLYTSSGEPAGTILVGGVRQYQGAYGGAPDATDLTATLRRPDNTVVRSTTRNVFVAP